MMIYHFDFRKVADEIHDREMREKGHSTIWRGWAEALGDAVTERGDEDGAPREVRR